MQAASKFMLKFYSYFRREKPFGDLKQMKEKQTVNVCMLLLTCGYYKRRGYYVVSGVEYAVVFLSHYRITVNLKGKY